MRRRDVAFVGVDVGVAGAGAAGAAVAGVQELIASGGLKGCVKDRETGALLAELLANAGAEAACCAVDVNSCCAGMSGCSSELSRGHT